MDFSLRAIGSNKDNRDLARCRGQDFFDQRIVALSGVLHLRVVGVDAVVRIACFTGRHRPCQF